MSEWVTIKTGTETRALNLACVRRVDFDDTGAALLHLVGEDPHVKHRLVGGGRRAPACLPRRPAFRRVPRRGTPAHAVGLLVAPRAWPASATPPLSDHGRHDGRHDAPGPPPRH